MSVSANVVILTLDPGSMGDEAFVFINYRYRKSFVISSTEGPLVWCGGGDHTRLDERTGLLLRGRERLLSMLLSYESELPPVSTGQSA